MKGTREKIHGKLVDDPYRWLENRDSSKTKKWIKKQKKKTREYFSQIPFHNKVISKLEKLMEYEEYLLPYESRDYYYFQKREGLTDQPVLYRQNKTTSKLEIILNPNDWSEDGTVALTNYFPHNNKEIMAYTITKSGSDLQQINILDLKDKTNYKEVLKHIKFTNITWDCRGNGFYYSQFSKSDKGNDSINSNNQVYWHQLNTPQSKDKLVYEDKDNTGYNFSPQLTTNDNYLLLRVSKGTSSNNGIYIRNEMVSNPNFKELFPVGEARYDFIGYNDDKLFFLTDRGAEKGKVIALHPEQSPDKNNYWTVINEDDNILERVNLIGERLVAIYLQDAKHIIKIFNLQGEPIHKIQLPFPASIGMIRGRKKGKEFIFTAESFLQPRCIYKFNLNSNHLKKIKDPDYKFDFTQYTTKQDFYQSKDGTKIPIYLIHQQDIKLNGNNPALLYGYGGFDISLTPAFSPSTLFWLKQGGVFAQANLRGGGEYGKGWHEDGMLNKKQNVFDDFISAGKWLIEKKYTRSNKLASWGRSNGGLLVAATLIQQPDLFRAVVCNVPVTDMLRYHKFTVGHFWIPEYGNPDNPEHFDFLYNYSPLHNIKDGVSYPATIVGTADTDDRVVPHHARKFAAQLQAANTGKNPILYREENKAGHGFGKPISKVIKEKADFYTFILNELKGTFFEQD